MRQNVPLYISVLLTLVNLFLVVQNNNIAADARRVTEANLGFEIDKRSQDYVSKAFEDLYTIKDNRTILERLANNEIIGNSKELLGIIDELEAVGSDFCQGTAKARHIRIYFLTP